MRRGQTSFRKVGILFGVSTVPLLVCLAAGGRSGIGLAAGLGTAFLLACLAAWYLDRRGAYWPAGLEEHLARLGNLSETGQLAASMAHEVRNPLTSIKGFLRLIQAKLTDPLLLEYTSIMSSEIDRAVSLISDFLELARPGKMQPEFTDLHTLIHQVISLIEGKAFLQNVSITEDCEPHLPSLWLDQKQMKQVLLNLLQNALEAMPGGGTITVRTRLDPTGRQVVTQVEDTGSGIDPAILEKIGQPFITTKEKGTGLGLAISCHIVQEHGGRLAAHSLPGQGSTFTIYLPVPPAAGRASSFEAGT